MLTLKDIREMEKMVAKYNEAYYNDNESLVSDKTYDDLVRTIQDWYKENDLTNVGVTSKVGSSLVVNNRLNKIRHRMPMLSLSNSYNLDEVQEFLTKYNIKEWVAENKMDGLSLSVTYYNGKIIKAATRGDGVVGEDVLQSVMQISNIPSQISVTREFEVRGEVLIPRKEFEKINEQQDELGLQRFANSRNLASGTLRQLDTTLVKRRGLKFVAYYICNPINIETQDAVLETLKDLGFEIPNFIVSKNSPNLQSTVDALRHNNEYDTDGVVFKNRYLKEWTETTSKVPKWAFAYKYPTQQVESKLIGVTWQVGRTGKITPVAELEPVVISGTTVSRATLHNINEVRKKDIRVNDYVTVEKAGEIIPQVVGPVVSKRSKLDAIEIKAVSSCPECGGEVVERDSNFFCINPECRSKKIESIAYFADRVNMNIQGLGRSTVTKLVDNGLLTDIPSIYELKHYRDTLVKLDKMSDRSVDKLLDEIELSRKQSFGKLLGSLGIDTVGRSVGQALATKYPNWLALIKGTANQYFDVKGIGKATSDAIRSYMLTTVDSVTLSAIDKANNLSEILPRLTPLCNRVIALHIGENQDHIKGDKFKGKTFCVTGKLPVARNLVKEYIESQQGVFGSSVSKAANFMIVGLNPTGHKIAKAKELGIKMISYDQLMKM